MYNLQYPASREHLSISSSLLVPYALNQLGFVEYKQLEKNDTIIYRWLDEISGIDWLARDNQGNVYGLATRIRFITSKRPYPYKEYTIRLEKSDKDAEFGKRIKAITNGYLYPTHTLQAWFSASADITSSVFLCGATMPTVQLYDFMDKHSYSVKEQYSDRPFLAVSWDLIKSAGYNINIINN